jgi:hypothetical protein
MAARLPSLSIPFDDTNSSSSATTNQSEVASTQGIINSRGPVDFKISRGLDKTVIEIKLTTNSQVLHGFEVQIEEYAKSEGTQNKIFMLVDNGGSSICIDKVYESYEMRKLNKENPATIIVIDAKPKASASKF